MSMKWICNSCNEQFTKLEELEYHMENCATVGIRVVVQKPSTNTASAQCKCVVKRTEVLGMGIIYSQRECPIHGHLNSAHC